MTSVFAAWGRHTGYGTRAVRAGCPNPSNTKPTLPCPGLRRSLPLPGDPTCPTPYGRDENPTWTLL